MSQPQPFMREKTHWIIIILLTLALLLVIFNQVRQEQTFKELSKRLDSPAAVRATPAIKPPQAVPSSQVSSPSAPAIPAQLHMDIQRAPFGSLTSPDGKWRLDYTTSRNERDGIVSVAQQLILHSLSGQLDVVAYSAKEFRKESFEALAGQAYASTWKPAGWSADGSKIYFVSFPDTDGFGGAYADFQEGGDTLHEVTLATKTDKKLWTRDGMPLAHGIRDVLPQKNVLVSSKFDDASQRASIYLRDLQGGHVRRVFQAEKGQDISGAILNGDGTRLVIMVNEPDAVREGMGAYIYLISAYDLVNNRPIRLTIQNYIDGDLLDHQEFDQPIWKTLTRFSFMEGNMRREYNIP